MVHVLKACMNSLFGQLRGKDNDKDSIIGSENWLKKNNVENGVEYEPLPNVESVIKYKPGPEIERKKTSWSKYAI